MNKYRVRFAPSPTGELHVGNARTALFNWMFARHHGGSFVLRIEDTDESRSDVSYQINLLNDLNWLGLDWDEGPRKEGLYGPYKQSERLEIYKSHLQKLMDADLVYPCYCTEEELEEERQALILSKRMPRYMGKCRNLTADERKKREEEGRKPSFRFKVNPQIIEFEDLIRGEMKFEGESIGDFIIVRSNGIPSYNFAVVIDDHLMGITHVIRGEDHLSNTALQLMLYRAFDFLPPTFAHHSLILGKDRAKLSKRHGSVSVGEFRKQGILPEALINYLGLLGSSFTDAREVLSREEMINGFALERASKSGAVFDEEKLHWLNAIYIRNSKTEDLIELLKPFMEQAGYDKIDSVDPKWLNNIIDLIKNDLTTLAEIGNHIDIFFDDKYKLTTEAKKVSERNGAGKVIRAFFEYLKTATGTPVDIYSSAIKYTKGKTGAKGKELFMPIRAVITGKVHGPELDKVFEILGQETALKRLKSFNG
ncbi:glutamyl-trna synthetase [hydrocarbon metagenome]|uniref:glutamate--tRNA ligase n=1 Tax=hydrocarbon metagenome TaxID=938273 RepID=A0A0W8FLV5_9ZZZZ